MSRFIALTDDVGVLFWVNEASIHSVAVRHDGMHGSRVEFGTRTELVDVQEPPDEVMGLAGGDPADACGLCYRPKQDRCTCVSVIGDVATHGALDR